MRTTKTEFVLATPESELRKKLPEVDQKGFKIKVVEKAGTRLVRLLQSNDPFKTKSCRDAQRCMVCKSQDREEGGDCRESGVTYRINCLGKKEGNPEEHCGEPYHGETNRNCYTRGCEHEADLDNRRENSALWKHCVEKHGGVKQRFGMVQVDRARNDATKRQILEAVRIQRESPD